ncbi:type II toxin-antitoxin system HipA family toxinoxin YjjJ [Spartobacteria bacterium LR76]|nr:type II toxin-antitoxin system HipA family toxinoxin YjjJ [Spartobacteria bacterium LR76]
MSFEPTSLRQEFLRHGVRSAAELARTAGVSQPTISRALHQLGEMVVRIGSGRSARYGFAAPIEDLGADWPLYLFGADGAPEQIGSLHLLLGGKVWIERNTSRWESLFDPFFPDNVFPDLPWFLDEYRPQGFLGRAFALKHGRALGQEGTNPGAWNARAVVEGMVRFGEDFPGAFVLGREALRTALASRPAPVARASRDREYPMLAEHALGGALIGSSAGGEQPKFVIEQDSPEGRRQLIVKFSPPMAEPMGQRWADLLQAEHIAGEVLREYGITAAWSEILDAGGRRFLEVERFDRTQEGGRVPVVSLRALAAALLDTFGEPWPREAEELRQTGWLSEAEAGELASIWRFGRLIANTDMHDGNASLILSPAKPARLAPVYDMLPMGYRPDTASGQIPGLSQDLAAEEIAASFPKEREMAGRFWTALAGSKMVSPGFREIAASHAVALTRRA